MENRSIGPFDVSEKLGSHRRHQVYRARQTEQQREVALKFIKIPANLPIDQVLQKINLESEQLKELSHPNLVRFYGAGVEGDRIFFASRLVKGESLATLLGRRSRMAPDMVIDYSKQVASALAYLHEKNLIHSKLTPDKLLVDKRGVVRLIDIRLNRARRRRWDAPRRQQMEIAAYMAPEALTGKGATSLSDIYSLGVIMYEMLTGELPFEPDTLNRMIRRKKQGQIAPIHDQSVNCPIWLEQVVMSLLDPNPRLRPQSADEVVTALREIKAFDKQKKSTFFQRMDRLNSDRPSSESFNEQFQDFKNRITRPDLPWYQRPSVSLVGLALLVAAMSIGIMIANRPLTNEQLLEKATRLASADSDVELTRAISLLDRVGQKNKDPNAQAMAREKQRQLKTQRLLHRAEEAPEQVDSSLERSFVHAYQAEQDGEFEKAIQLYRHLIAHVEKETDSGYLQQECTDRLAKLVIRVDEIEEKTRQIDKKIREARMAITQNDFVRAREILREIIRNHESEPDLRWVIERARSELRKLDS